MKQVLMTRSLLLIILASAMLGVGGCASFPSQNDKEGSMKLEDKAKQGDALSQYRMGLQYTTGETQNYKKAGKWFRKAALQGNQDAQYMLGITYYVGRGLPRNYAVAADWFQKAADQGHARAQYQLGEVYMNGRGVNKEPAWAARWYGKAAEQAHAEAQFSLGVVFARGLGLPVNPVRSCQWLMLAERSGQVTAATVHEIICTGLSDEQRERARNLAAKWKVRKYLPDQDPPTLRYIQFRLQDLGFDPGYVDGVNGEQTRQAIQRYLTDSGKNNQASSLQSLVIHLRKEP